MNLELNDHVIIVTGGAKGIGEGIVNVLAREGAIPVIVGRNEQDNQKTLSEIQKICPQAIQITAELTQPEACARAVRQTIEKFGRINGLVNNAGVNDGIGLEHGNYEQFMASLHKNLVHYSVCLFLIFHWMVNLIYLI